METRTRKRTIVKVKNISVEADALRVSTFEREEEITLKLDRATNKESNMIRRKILSTEHYDKVFTLSEVTPEQLKCWRFQSTPYFVRKISGVLYATEIIPEINLSTFHDLGPHVCAMNANACARLNPCSDEDGGCAKVRNFACFIENYPFITDGYETVGTVLDTFTVLACKNYLYDDEPRPRRVYSKKKKQA